MKLLIEARESRFRVGIERRCSDVGGKVLDINGRNFSNDFLYPRGRGGGDSGRYLAVNSFVIGKTKIGSARGRN